MQRQHLEKYFKRLDKLFEIEAFAMRNKTWNPVDLKPRSCKRSRVAPESWAGMLFTSFLNLLAWAFITETSIRASRKEVNKANFISLISVKEKENKRDKRTLKILNFYIYVGWLYWIYVYIGFIDINCIDWLKNQWYGIIEGGNLSSNFEFCFVVDYKIQDTQNSYQVLHVEWHSSN